MRRGGLAVLSLALVMFIAGSVIGFNLLTSSADTTVAVPTCEDRTIAKGEDITSNLVTVNVYNASRTAGLANRVSILLQRRGYLTGSVANNPTEETTDDVVILTSDRTDPMVKLVRAQFRGKVSYVDAPVAGDDGVSILVGRNYASRGLSPKGAKAKVAADRDVSVCVPILPIT